MIKCTVDYDDFFENHVEEDLYFHLSKRDVMALFEDETSPLRVMTDTSKSDEARIKAAIDLFSLAYGVRSEDGKHFVKNEQVRNDFENSLAFEAFLDNVLFKKNEHEIVDFMLGIFPKDVREEIVSKLQATA